MRFLRFLLCSFALLNAVNVSFASTSDDLLNTANQAYQDGNYQTAIQSYETLLSEYPNSTDLHFNLGNAYFRTKQLGKSILHLERAALFSPNDKDVQHNLAVVKDQLTDQIEVLPEFFMTRWWNGLRAALRPTGWGILGLLFLWAGIGGLLLWQRGAQRKLRKQGFVIGILLLLLSILPFCLSFSGQKYLKEPGRAVIMQQEVALRSAPDKASENLFSLHEGTSITIVDKIGDWYKVRLSNGEEGWLEINTLELV